jgi:L-serine/L-threonine ammonia-lyase
MSTVPFFIQSPLLHCVSPHLSSQVNAFLKLENLQPSGSFKDRGISHMINQLCRSNDVKKIICSSGGNAGHAVATAGRNLGIPVDVYVPEPTKPMMIEKLRSKGANVFLHGANWNEADKKAKEALAAHSNAIYIPPFDDPLIWEGNSTLVDEIAKCGVVPDKIVLSVGGGGLLCGVQRGILRHGWQNRTKIIAAETSGTASFAAATEAGRPVSLPGISSVASSLGALSVTPACLNTGVETIPYVVTDKDAVTACRRFADDYNMLVEPACGAALSYIYCNPAGATENVNSGVSDSDAKRETVVVIVCGGSVVNVELMAQWCADFGVSSTFVK